MLDPMARADEFTDERPRPMVRRVSETSTPARCPELLNVVVASDCEPGDAFEFQDEVAHREHSIDDHLDVCLDRWLDVGVSQRTSAVGPRTHSREPFVLCTKAIPRSATLIQQRRPIPWPLVVDGSEVFVFEALDAHN